MFGSKGQTCVGDRDMLIVKDTKMCLSRSACRKCTGAWRFYLKGSINCARCLRNLVVVTPSSLSRGNAAQRDGPHTQAINKLKQFTINPAFNCLDTLRSTLINSTEKDNYCGIFFSFLNRFSKPMNGWILELFNQNFIKADWMVSCKLQRNGIKVKRLEFAKIFSVRIRSVS